MTAIVDYRAGNLTSVKYAFDALGEPSVVTSDPSAIERADRVVFPGVGAAKSAMATLASLGLVDVVRRVASAKPFLGICLGMQILFDHTEEDGGVDGLGILPGRVLRFPENTADKVPQIGWNDVAMKNEELRMKNDASRSEASADNSSFYYFVHSYYVELNPYAIGTTEYAGVAFASMVRKGSILACQFHPEKSGRAGLALLREWLQTPQTSQTSLPC